MSTILDKSAHNLTHNLTPHFEAIKAFQTLAALQNSALYGALRSEIERVIEGVAYCNTVNHTPGEIVRIVAWNIERGLKLDGVIDLLKTHPVLSKADILLVTEADIGMGRSQNRDVPHELAQALEMNYVFANCFLALEKGDIGEQDHDIPNTLALHGMCVFSRFPIEAYRTVSLPMFKDTFTDLEKRLGSRKGLICTIPLGTHTYDFGVTHIELATSAPERGKQMAAMLNVLEEGTADACLMGGDLNTTTYNLRSKHGLFLDLFYKLSWGVTRVVEHYMTPELHFEKPLFDEIAKRGFDINRYNDRSVGTVYYNMNDKNVEAKIRQYRVPQFALRWLRGKLSRWDCRVPLKLDWFAGKGCDVVDAPAGDYGPPQVVDMPLWQGAPVSDHSPIVVDLHL